MSSPQEPEQILKVEPCPADTVEKLAALYRQAYPKLTAIAAGILGHLEDAEDIVQQAASIAIEKGKRFDSGPHFVGWLAGVVRHCALNHRRKSRGRRTYASDPSDLAQLVEDTPPSVSRLPIHPESGNLLPDQESFDDDVLHALQSLGEETRCCLLLRTVHKLSYAEIAELLQIPAGTAMSRVHRGKQTLRARLMQHDVALDFKGPSKT